MMEWSNDIGPQSFLLLQSAFGLKPPFKSTVNPQNVSIIVVGKGGTGLSLTVQKILGTATNVKIVAKKTVVDDTEGYVIEYEVLLPNTEGTLKIVDVEGVIEGKAIGHDKKVFSCLASYLADEKGGLGGYLPNFCLIISNFDDIKFLGPKTSLARMLKKIDNLQTIMQENVTSSRSYTFKNIMLLTKLMNVGGNTQRKPETKLSLFSNAFEQYTDNIVQILTGSPLVGDNMWGQDRITQQGFTTLPNGELYPGNVIDRIFTNAKGNGPAKDIIGKFRDVRNSLTSYQVVSSFY